MKVISFLIRELPDENDYRVLFMRRDLGEVLASQQKMIDRLASQDTDAGAEAMMEAFRNDIARVRLVPDGPELRASDPTGAIARPAARPRRERFRAVRLDEAGVRAAVDASCTETAALPATRRVGGASGSKNRGFPVLAARDPGPGGPAPDVSPRRWRER